MRTLTLADELRQRGAEVTFLTREYPGNMNIFLESVKKYQVLLLNGEVENEQPGPEKKRFCADDRLLEVPWQSDCLEAKEKIKTLFTHNDRIDWLIVDHYSLDVQWESSIREFVDKVMVIDDLANREHDADLLLDQNLYDGMESRYDGLVPGGCRKLLGPKYALLRPEFQEARKTLRERDGRIRRLMVFFGGSDPNNATMKVLRSFSNLGLENIEIDVVVGGANPKRDHILDHCKKFDNIQYHYNVDNIAMLMAAADLFVGSGGTSTWERCCLGLPSMVVAVADNQVGISKSIDDHGMGIFMGSSGSVSAQAFHDTIFELNRSPEKLVAMNKRCLAVVDGLGVPRVAEFIAAFGSNGAVS